MNLTSLKPKALGLAGVLAGLASLITQIVNQHYDAASVAASLSGISAGWGVMFARANLVTSESAGAK